MMAKRKRAPGGGRKRLGQALARNLTIRIDDELRERLEIEAGKRAKRKRNWSLSQEILLRLGQSLARERRDDTDAATRAICYLISEKLAKVIRRKDPDWHRNPYWFRTFKVAVNDFLGKIEPPGEIITPARLSDSTAKTPEARGEFLSDILFDELTLSRPMTPTERARALGPEHFDGDEDAVSEIQGELYDIERARKHLEIESGLTDWPEKKKGD